MDRKKWDKMKRIGREGVGWDEKEWTGRSRMG